MKAIILNSGEGKRMGHYTDDKPKCMVELNDETILSRQLRLLSEKGIKEIVITTGPFEDKLKEHVEEVYNELKIEYVHNLEYKSTNYIYSLYLAKELIGPEDILLLHGDLVFEKRILDLLLYDDKYSRGLVNHDESLKKDFNACIEDGFVKEIGVDIDGKVGFMPFYFLKNEDFKRWMGSMESFVEDGKKGVYAENALNPLLKKEKLKIQSVDFSDLFCMEIDTEPDLKKAKSFLGD